MATLSAPEVTKEIFGGIFDVDGAGHFPGLELINFVVCGDADILPAPDGQEMRIRRVSHDFARRLVADTLAPDQRAKVLLDPHSENAVAHLLRCLELEVPGALKTKTKSWERTHFFPYTRSLVHWDARSARGTEGRGSATLERRYLRGGGAYAFSVLRHDSQGARLASIREGFRILYPAESRTPLETLAAALRQHGVSDETPVPDKVEPDSKLRADDWEDLYRDGIRNILSYRTLPGVQRIRAVMNWTGIWLVLLEAGRAAKYCSKEWTGFVLDCAGAHPQLRRASQKCLNDHLANIEDAAKAFEQRKEGKISGQQLNKIKGFFSSTAATCGLLNAAKGRRHFTLRLGAIEALVLAATEDGREMAFEDFVTDWMGRRCGLLIGREAATKAGLLSAFDSTIFEENERQFAQQLRITGMLRVYSDATRMVAPEVSQ